MVHDRCALHSSGKGPSHLLWAGSRAANVKIKISGITNPVNYCPIFLYVCDNAIIIRNDRMALEEVGWSGGRPGLDLSGSG